jgi:hypothetical protein
MNQLENLIIGDCGPEYRRPDLVRDNPLTSPWRHLHHRMWMLNQAFVSSCIRFLVRSVWQRRQTPTAPPEPHGLPTEQGDKTLSAVGRHCERLRHFDASVEPHARPHRSRTALGIGNS